ncbi:hypothetical protein GTP55_24250 [Duganella sp. FT109W]|uniref:Hok/Gef family protein n=1 Tax=Duganella margarita TaxID=2692170 RepID=A0ABW9WMM8_9BURK|nr:hypothetical protein [Duganella margarita]MYN42457.1 hypothetical protein [Duganella margarita]
MIRYLVAAVVVVIVAWLWRLNSECEAAGGVLVRGTFQPVCVKSLEIQQ